jgi:hypothetical protein
MTDPFDSNPAPELMIKGSTARRRRNRKVCYLSVRSDMDNKLCITALMRMSKSANSVPTPATYLHAGWREKLLRGCGLYSGCKRHNYFARWKFWCAFWVADTLWQIGDTDWQVTCCPKVPRFFVGMNLYGWGEKPDWDKTPVRKKEYCADDGVIYHASRVSVHARNPFCQRTRVLAGFRRPS